MGAELARIARDSASYYDLTSESACHMLVLGLLYGMRDYAEPQSNREAGYGRFDVQVVPEDASSGLPVVTVEVKFAREGDTAGRDVPAVSGAPGAGRDGGACGADCAQDPERGADPLARLARGALAQVESRAYDAGTAPALPRVRWGVAFAGKRVAVACKQA